MKQIFKIVLVLFFCILVNKSLYANSFGVLGQTKKYNVLVNAKKDCSLDMEYKISLKVTGKSVDNIKIKLPLGDVSTVSYDSNVINDISYSYKKAKIKLNKTYTNGQVINLNFKINIKDAYSYLSKKGLLSYRLVIGDVKDFVNNNISVKWNKDKVYFQGMGKEEGKYYVFNEDYSLIKNFEIMIQYRIENFNLEDINETFKFEKFLNKFWLFAVGIFVIIYEIKKNVINKEYSKRIFGFKNII